MKTYGHVKGVASIDARITESDAGGFTAVASTGRRDRDGEILIPGCFNPLPETVPVHLDHVMTARNAVAFAHPYYVGDQLRIDATFGTDDDAQLARRKVSEGLVGAVSVVFLPSEKRDVKGVPTVFSADLMAVDLVSIPSNSDARILASRSFNPTRGAATAYARKAALMAIVDVELDEARRTLKSAQRNEVARTKSEIRAFLRSL